MLRLNCFGCANIQPEKQAAHTDRLLLCAGFTPRLLQLNQRPGEIGILWRRFWICGSPTHLLFDIPHVVTEHAHAEHAIVQDLDKSAVSPKAELNFMRMIVNDFSAWRDLSRDCRRDSVDDAIPSTTIRKEWETAWIL